MWRAVLAVALGVVLAGTVVAHTVFAQNQPAVPAPHAHDHGSVRHGSDMHAQHMQAMRGMTSNAPMMPGQDTFGAIAEIVRILEADPATDWTKVDIERLRQHLVDMNEVMLRSAVKQMPIPGGRAMVVPHASELDRMPSFTAKTETLADGVRLIVIAKQPDDVKLVARIRGLGFAGLMTEGAHHQPHHLAMAKGEAIPGHSHAPTK